MDAERHQHLVWPLLLILTGLLLLLNQLGVLSLSWYAIWHLWPLVLVLIGLDILLNHTRLGAVVFLVVSSAVILLAVALLPRLGHRASNLEDMALSHPVAGIESAEVRLQVGVGELTVSATEDAEHLYEALVTHDPSHTKIIHDVATEGDVARIRLRSEHQRSPAGGVAGDRWQVSLNAGVATHLRIDGGLNKIRLDLGGLRLSGLVVNMCRSAMMKKHSYSSWSRTRFFRLPTKCPKCILPVGRSPVRIRFLVILSPHCSCA